MDFKWDEVKSSACFLERGFDFAFAASAFDDPDRIIWQDNRYSCEEDRYQLVGRIGKRLLVLAYTLRGGVIRIISARKANAREVKRYENRSYED